MTVSLCLFDLDDFAIVLEGRTESEALSISARVMERVARTAFEHGENVGLSVGIAAHPQGGLDMSEPVMCADVALYAAKDGGKNQVACYRPGLEPPSRGHVVERASGVAPVAQRKPPRQPLPAPWRFASLRPRVRNLLCRDGCAL